jgi:hypothetical protein
MERPSQREQALNALELAIQDHTWEACLEGCFRALYQAPRELQIEFARVTLSEFLPTFEQRWPGIVWPRQLLSDTPGWLIAHRRTLPDDPVVVGPADAAFFQGLDGLLLAYDLEHEDFLGITASCVFAAGRGIQAQTNTAWESDDPEGVRKWQALSSSISETALEDILEGLRGHTAEDSASAIETFKRQWHNAVNWLRAKGILKYPDPVQESLEKDFLRWKDREMTLPRIN